MQTKILYLFTRTPLHVGAGASVGAIDQPVRRERHTGLPLIPGSSIKGVLADGADYLARDEQGKILKDESRNSPQRSDSGARLFGLGAGKQDGDNGRAGAISFGDASLLAFPVRSAKGCFAWLTSPLLLNRWARATDQSLAIPQIKDHKARFSAASLGETLDGQSTSSILLEDVLLHHDGEFDLAPILASSSSDDPLWSGLAPSHLVLVSDSILSHFAETACEVAQHVVIDDETGTAKDGLLFNQENVPAETLFFAPLNSADANALGELKVPNPVQVGGDATTGLGFCTTNLSDKP